MTVSTKIAGDLESAAAGASLNLTGFTASPDNSANNGAFPGSSFDVFGITDRSVNFDFADDSAGTFAPDTFGILKTGDTAPFFGAQDVDNSDNPGGTGTATWTFDITGNTLAEITIDFAAMGDFEAGDNEYTITAAIDGGSLVTLFSVVTDDTISHTYTMEGGATVSLNDPMVIDGTVIDNDFATFTSAALSGLTGSTLDLTLTAAVNNGGSEAFAMRDIAILGAPAAAIALSETFDSAAGFTTSEPFFSDGFSDYFGLTDGAGSGDFGAGAVPANEKAYTNTTGSYLTGMDLDGEGASLPITVEWTGIDISALSAIEFSGDFAEFFDSPGDIDSADQLFVEANIDGAGYTTILSFVGADFSSSSSPSNGVFRQDTNLDGTGDGAALTNAFATFTAPIAGTGTSMDLRLTTSVNSGDEDFAVDNFIVREFAAATPGITISGAPAISEDGATDTFSIALDTTPSAQVDVNIAVSDSQTEVSLDGITFAASVTANLSDTTPVDITVRAIDDAADEGTHSGTIAFAVASADTDYNGLVVPDITADIIDNDLAVTKIHDIQGNAASWGSEFGYNDVSPLHDTIVKIQGIVVGDFQDGTGTHGDFNGFYVQEEDADVDGDASTSEGIFVFDGSSPAVDVNAGDLVEITGTVDEFFGETQIDTVTSVKVLSSGNSLPTAAEITFPVADIVINPDGQKNADLEAYEGMLVTIPNSEDLVVSDLFTLGRFGEVGLTAGGRNEAFTQNNAPSVAGFTAFEDDAVKNTVVLDDGSSAQNPSSLPYPDGNFDGDEELRAGDSVDNVTGVVRYSSGSGSFGDSTYRINPTDTLPTFTNDNPRDGAPEVTGSLTVASMNVLNFFTTIDGSGFTSGPAGLDPRGADSSTEYGRQLDKLVTTIAEMDADILGLMEIENEFGGDVNGDGNGFAVGELVDALNASLGAGTYDYVDPGRGFVDTSDAISQAFIYQTATVGLTAGTTVEILEDADLAGLGLGALGPVFDGASTNRAVLAATFEELATGEDVTIAVNHFKSKGDFSGTASGGNLDAGDGAANYNEMRLKGATALDAWLDTDPTGSGDADFLIIGDLNAYAMEDPIQYLLSQGYTDLAADYTLPGELNYSFGFPISLETSSQAQIFGTLDYGLANGALAAQVTGAEKWHINADEPSFFDYNQEFKTLDPFTSADAFRSSDHDPLIIGLSLFSATDPVAVYADGSFSALLSTHATFADALATATAGQAIRVLDPAAVGDVGAVTVATDDLTILGTAPFDGGFTLSGAQDLTVLGQNTANLRGTGAPNTLIGSDGDNTLDGLGGADSLSGGAGNDTLLGGGGDDTLEGGAGNDQLDGGGGADSLAGGDGNDTLDGSFGNDVYLSGDAGDDRVLGSGGSDTILGGTGDDLLLGDAAADSIDGGTGDDTIVGEIGEDTLTGGLGNDSMTGGNAPDLLFGGTGDDSLSGQGSDDTIYGDDGNDSISGGASADQLFGGAGDDSLDGGAFRDSLEGGDGNDLMQGGGNADTLLGGDGNDTMDGGTDNDSLLGEAGDDSVAGGSGKDTIDGGIGNDVLSGGNANDTITGGSGDDTMSGGAGTDSFVFASGWGTDEITDFNASLEKLDLSATGQTFADLTITSAAADTLITDLSGNTITLTGVNASAIDATDFIF